MKMCLRMLETDVGSLLQLQLAKTPLRSWLRWSTVPVQATALWVSAGTNLEGNKNFKMSVKISMNGKVQVWRLCKAMV